MKPRKVVYSPLVIDDFARLLKAGADVFAETRRGIEMIAAGRGQQPPGDHALTGPLHRCRAFAVGHQDGVNGPRVVYRIEGAKLRIIAAGFHDEAYALAIARKWAS